jgi:hypothetical protein
MIYSGGGSEQRQSVRSNNPSTLFRRSNIQTQNASTRTGNAGIEPASIQEGDCASEDQNSHMNILTIDGQHWDISNLSTSSSSHHDNIRNAKVREVKRLYPRITDDEEDILSNAIDRKTRRAPVADGCTLRRKNPASMTLRSYANGPPKSPTTAGVADATDRAERESSPSLFQSTEESEPTADMEATSSTNAPLRQQAAIESNTRENAIRSSQSRTNPFYFPDENEEQLTLEVAPGVEVVLRGSAETRAAIYNWDILRAHCLECTVLLHCIEDAKYLLCPLCRCVSPLALCVGSGNILPASAYGVGLGFQSCPQSGRRRRQESEAAP